MTDRRMVVVWDWKAEGRKVDCNLLESGWRNGEIGSLTLEVMVWGRGSDGE